MKFSKNVPEKEGVYWALLNYYVKRNDINYCILLNMKKYDNKMYCYSFYNNELLKKEDFYYGEEINIPKELELI